MNRTKTWAAALLGLAFLGNTAQAWYRSPALKTPLGFAPDACGPGFYTMCSPDGSGFGPNYCVYPPCAPFNGLMPADKWKQLQDLQGRGIYHQGPLTPAAAPGPGYGPGGPGYPGVAPGQGFAPGYARGPNGMPTPGYAPGVGYSPYTVPLPNPGYAPPQAVQPPPSFPSHPFARSPRDFFMWSDVMQDRAARAARPSLVP